MQKLFILISAFTFLISLNTHAALVATSVSGGTAVDQNASVVTLDVGTSATRSVSTTITFKNTGSTVESISSLQGADSSLFKMALNRCNNIAVNKTCQITVSSSRAIQARVAPYLLEVGTLDLSISIKQNGQSEPPAPPAENVSFKFIPDTLSEVQFNQGQSSATVSLEVLNDGNVSKQPSLAISSNPNASTFLINRCSSVLPVGKKCSVSFRLKSPAPGVTHNQVFQVLENSVLKDSISLVVKGPSSSKNLILNKLASSLSHGKILVTIANNPAVELDAQSSLTVPVTPGDNVSLQRVGGTPQSILSWNPSHSSDAYSFYMPNEDLTLSLGVECPVDYSLQNGSCLYSLSRISSLIKNITTSTKGFSTTVLDFINVHNKVYVHGSFDSSNILNTIYQTDGTSLGTNEIVGYGNGIKKLFSFNGDGYFLRKNDNQLFKITNTGVQTSDLLQSNTGQIPQEFGYENNPHTMPGHTNLYYATWTEDRDPDTYEFIQKSLNIYKIGLPNAIASISSSHPSFSLYGESYSYVPLTVMETSSGEVLLFEIKEMFGPVAERFLFNMTTDQISSISTNGYYDPNTISSSVVSNGSYGIIKIVDGYDVSLVKVNGITTEVIESMGIISGNQMFKSGNEIYYAYRSNFDQVSLVKKINNLGVVEVISDLSSYTEASLSFDKVFVQNGVLYFSGFDSFSFSSVLAKVNLSTGLVSKIADISNQVTGVFESNGNTYVSLIDSNFGHELWMVDGSSLSLVSDLMPGTEDGLIRTSSYTQIGEELSFEKIGFINNSPIFLAKTQDSGIEFRTISGSVISEVKNLNSRENGTITYVPSQSTYLSSVSVNNKVIFIGLDTQSGFNQLYSTDGTTNGTSKIATIVTGATGGSLSYLTKLNNEEALFVHSRSSKLDIWRTDGTVNGTILVKSNLPLMASNRVHDRTEGGYAQYKPVLVRAGNKLVYVGFNTFIVSDGTAGGTSERPLPLSSLAMSSGGVYPLKSFNGKVYFASYRNVSSTTINYLLEYDPASDSINQVLSYTRNSSNSYAPELLTHLFFDNQDAYFSNIDVGQGKGLYKVTNGVATRVLAQGAQENFEPMFVRNGYLYHHHILGSVVSVRKLNLSNFQVTTYTDGASNLNLVKYIQDGIGGMYLFAGLGSSSSRKLYRVDLNTDSISVVFALSNGAATSAIVSDIFSSNGFVYFGFTNLFDLSAQNNLNELWISNGTLAGTRAVGNINPIISRFVEGFDGKIAILGFINNGNTVVYAQEDGTIGTEIYKY